MTEQAYRPHNKHTDAELLTLYQNSKEILHSLKETIEQLEAEIWHRLRDRDATVLVGDNLKITLSPGKHYYQYLENILGELREYLSPEEWDAIQETTIKWSKPELNSLMKRGDPFNEILGRGIVDRQSGPTLELKSSA